MKIKKHHNPYRLLRKISGLTRKRQKKFISDFAEKFTAWSESEAGQKQMAEILKRRESETKIKQMPK